MKNNVENIFAEMRRERMYPVNEEQVSKVEDVNETSVEQTDEEYETVYDATKEESTNEEETSEDSKVEEDLTVDKKATNGRAFTVEINGKKYSYFPTEESGLTAKELGEKYSKIAKYSVGKALSWLKKNATTPDSYRKPKNEEVEDQVNEEMQIVVDAEDILKAADAIKKAQEDGKTVTVTQSAGGFKVDTAEAEPKDEKDPEGKEDEPKGDEPEEEKNESCKKDETCDKDEEVCPVCGKKHKKGEKCCEEETSNESGPTDNESTNEEVDVAELAARLDECQGSDYMKHALEDGRYNLVKKYLYLKEE